MIQGHLQKNHIQLKTHWRHQNAEVTRALASSRNGVNEPSDSNIHEQSAKRPRTRHARIYRSSNNPTTISIVSEYDQDVGTMDCNVGDDNGIEQDDSHNNEDDIDQDDVNEENDSLSSNNRPFSENSSLGAESGSSFELLAFRSQSPELFAKFTFTIFTLALTIFAT